MKLTGICIIMKLINLKRIYHHKHHHHLIHSILLFGLLFSQHFYAVTGNLTLAYSSSTECSEDPLCLRCNARGCMKCPQFILVDSRRCVESCPNGYTAQWSAVSEFMGRVCLPIGLSGSLLAAIVGVTAGALLCILALIVGITILKRKFQRKKMDESLIDDRIDRTEFIRQLDELRPQAEYFLQMLNDTRRQIRKLHLAGDNAAAATYHPVIRDLAKILILLNRPVELISTVPHDWNRLSLWAERVLERYKPQLTQLIEFLQTPIPTAANDLDPTDDIRLDTSKHLTFKSNTLQSTKNPNHFLGSLISLQELDEAQSSHKNPFGDTFDHVKCYLSSSGINDSSLWLEDEFFKLGFRPQDEITTEL